MCTDAYREALTRDLSSTTPSAPTATPTPSERQRESIDAHLAVVFAALAVTRLIGDCVGQHTRTAEDPLPPDLRDAFALIK